MSFTSQLTSDVASAAAGLSGVRKQYGEGDTAVVALDDVSWIFEPATFTAVMGPSGSGKSTLLQVLAGLISPTVGEVYLAGRRIDQMSERQLALTRREHVGFVFQEFNLIPAFTAAENISLPLRLAKRTLDAEWFDEITRRAGISDRLDHLPAELSGGQQQRVALCRALVTRPALLCADEPTGALDSTTSRDVMTLMRQAVDTYDQTLVLVTHDPTAAAYADHVIFLVDGRITEVHPRGSAQEIAETLAGLGARA